MIRNPNATRAWQHVLEPLAGYLVLAERLHRSEAEVGLTSNGAWNSGPTRTTYNPWPGLPTASWNSGAGAHAGTMSAMQVHMKPASLPLMPPRRAAVSDGGLDCRSARRWPGR